MLNRLRLPLSMVLSGLILMLFAAFIGWTHNYSNYGSAILAYDLGLLLSAVGLCDLSILITEERPWVLMLLLAGLITIVAYPFMTQGPSSPNNTFPFEHQLSFIGLTFLLVLAWPYIIGLLTRHVSRRPLWWGAAASWAMGAIVVITYGQYYLNSESMMTTVTSLAVVPVALLWEGHLVGPAEEDGHDLPKRSALTVCLLFSFIMPIAMVLLLFRTSVMAM